MCYDMSTGSYICCVFFYNNVVVMFGSFLRTAHLMQAHRGGAVFGGGGLRCRLFFYVWIMDDSRFTIMPARAGFPHTTPITVSLFHQAWGCMRVQPAADHLIGGWHYIRCASLF